MNKNSKILLAAICLMTVGGLQAMQGDEDGGIKVEVTVNYPNVTNFGSGNYVVGEGNGGFNPEWSGEEDDKVSEELKRVLKIIPKKLYDAALTQLAEKRLDVSGFKTNDASVIDAIYDCMKPEIGEFKILKANTDRSTSEEKRFNALQPVVDNYKLIDIALKPIIENLPN
jgi:hypothetical protein